jgi:hypothetical protein
MRHSRTVQPVWFCVFALACACAKQPPSAVMAAAPSSVAGVDAGVQPTAAGSSGPQAPGLTGSSAGMAAASAGRGGAANGSSAGRGAAAGSGGRASSVAGQAGRATPPAAGFSAAGSGVNAGARAPGMLPYKGVANSPCAARSALKVSWYYNWMQTEKEPCSDGRGGEFVPMIWGHTGAEQTGADIANSISSFVKHGYTSVLGFNEPDNSSQSNIPVAKAISLWPSFSNPALRVGSPGTQSNANPGQAWFKDFVGQVNANAALQADFLALHWYGWNAGSCDAKASQLEGYVRWAEGLPGNRPIWITEWGCLNASAPDTATVVTFLKAAIAMLAKHPRVERYAWYPWATNCSLVDASGQLTELGNVYAAAAAYQ